MSTESQYNQTIATSIKAINKQHWEQVVQNRNVYLSIPYLLALERTMSKEMDFFYSISYNNDNLPILVCCFQLVMFTDKRNNGTQKVLKHLTKSEGDNFSMNALVCGNVFSDGENGFLWNNISEEEAINEAAYIAKRIKQNKETKKKLSMLLFKEFWPSSTTYSDELKRHSYQSFMVDVNMILKVHPKWNNMDDYLQSLKAKFRTRANSVFKKSKDLVIKSLTPEEIHHHHTRIEILFNNVLNKSDYSYGTINPNSFMNFKKELGDNFSFRGLFLDNELVGFSTAFFHRGIMEANYVGIDYSHNLDLAVYQRILYDYVEQAITSKSRELQLGRTSELIKSALGAEPVNMKLYARHKSAISNALIKPLFCFITPSEFELRKPFKAEFNN